MARFSFICCTFLMLSLSPCGSFLSSVAGSSLLSSVALSRRAPLHLATVRAKSTEAIKDVDPAKMAAKLVALLGSEEEARNLEPDLAREMLSCLRFLVPHAVSLPEASSMRRGFKSRKVMMHDKRINELIWWPPSPVMDIARSAVEWGADPAVIHRALNSTHYQVPDVEDCLEHKCQLTKTTFGRRFLNKDLNLYMSFLFETIAALSPSAGLNISLNRYDLFHGHLFLASNTGRLGILFHAKEYPAYNKESFPVHLGYCQTGSNLPYDYSMNLRNILWLAPLPDCSNKKCSTQWLAPGALVVLDAHPGGIIYEDLVGEWVQEFRTIYEDDFGDVILDVNYLNVANSPPENRIYLC
ncbi:uncharacterized protein LOC131030902 isoform X1 [Cryptomeria japonica]|uniref:uncharacterized protein LOC131030902 isoform X1 n=1 Tax=Cryptomeria japonica TaxID=3369 RepID=UPI0025AC7430|nr:uncharacterized protein LOC131030902 isoform X1 [Cryptomeria japonica]